MRWKLIRRRLSISAPRMIVRSHLPWPLRWMVLALALGFSAALAMWAFEAGKRIAFMRQEAVRNRRAADNIAFIVKSPRTEARRPPVDANQNRSVHHGRHRIRRQQGK